MNKKNYTLREIADYVAGELEGDCHYEIDGIGSISSAKQTQITFLASDKYLSQLKETNAGAVLLKRSDKVAFTGNVVFVDDPYLCFAKLSQLFDPRPRRQSGIHHTAVISDSATVADSASIGPNCYIGDHVTVGENTEIYPNVSVCENTNIGDHCLIYANVSIYSNVQIGDHVLIHSNTVIGSDGFGFAPSSEGWQKIHQLGGVEIGEHVEIGASCAIDRGALGNTVIESGVIIDNLVHIAHNVVIGEGTALAGCVGIAGSTKLGKRCIVAGAVAINGHIEIADGTQFHGGTVVTRGNSEPGVYASTAPLQEVKSWRKNTVRHRQLDRLFNRVTQLEKKIDRKQLEDKLD